MEQLFEFAGNHFLLVSVFIALLVLLVVHETGRGGRTISPQELVNLVNGAGAVVVDLREPKEFEAGHIVDAINIPHHALAERADELQAHKSKPVILACRLGQHTGAAGTLLRGRGFEQVLRLSGGIVEWQNSNLPLVRKS